MTFDAVLDWLKLYPAVIPTAMLLMTFGEALIFTSPLVPATVLALGMAGLHQAAGGQFASIAAMAIIGTFLGDLVSYWIGVRYRDTIATWWPFSKNPTLMPRAIVFFQKWGAAGLVGSKFLGPIRWFGPTVCGVLLMPRAQFLAVTAFASVLWVLIVLAPPFYSVKALGAS